MGGESGTCINGLVGKPDGKGPFGRPRRRGENYTKMDLQEIRWDID